MKGASVVAGSVGTASGEKSGVWLSFVCEIIYSVRLSFVCEFVYSFRLPFVCEFVYSFRLSFVYELIYFLLFFVVEVIVCL